MSTFNSALWNSTLWNGAGGAGGGVGRPVTAGQLIYDAYRALGVLRPGQKTSPEGHDDAFGLLNDMVDSWNTESLMIPSLTRTVYPLTAGVGTYTVGPGGSLSGARPQKVTSAALVSCDCGCGCAGDSGCQSLTLNTGWHDCACGNGIWIDGAYPDANLHINPPPLPGQALALQSWATLSGFADLDTAYGFAPGYALALRWNLAQELAPHALIMRKIPNVLLANIQERAISSKAAVKSFNSRTPEMSTGWGCGGGYDICQDTYL